MTTDENDPLLSVAEVADLIGVRPATVRTYNWRANGKREEGIATPADLPAPDDTLLGHPVWRRSTIAKWRQARAGVPNVKDVPPAN
ncbi:hypothetical protein ACFVJK_30400 [Streptomyces sp. NPDC127172]|uniref:hypothetical protein n=1 Tax=Streptomyces sp. NPDC127172 TaxID=3345382 RepID=UPI003628439E